MRIAIVGVSIEIMLSSPVDTDLDTIQEYDAADILGGDVWLIRGMLQRISEDSDLEAVPLYWATALPGGPLTAGAYAAIKKKTLDQVGANGPFDGILVANHGALEAAGLDRDADTDFVEAVRARVGPAVPIGVALDLHGDMTPGFLAAATVFSVLRTAPHRDDKETGYRAADQLIRVLRTGIRPRKAAVAIPILVPGETAVTSAPPAKALYGALPELDGRPDIMEANILVGFAWNDRPWTGVTALAVSESDSGKARAAAVELAQRIWAERHEFRLRMETAEVEAGLRRAAASDRTPVYLSDAGDNTTAGAPGDLTLVLAAALELGVEDFVFPGIKAPETVRRCAAAGVGQKVEIALGAEHVSRAPSTVVVTGEVLAVGERLNLGGFQPYRLKEAAWARVRIDGTIATFHEKAIGITTPHHLEAMGIHPKRHRAYVVKLGYLHPQLEDIAPRHILLLSDGNSQLDMTRLKWHRLRRPMIPLDRDFPWQPEEGLYGDG